MNPSMKNGGLSLGKAGFSRDGRILAFARSKIPFIRANPELWDTSRRRFVDPPWPEPRHFIGQEGDFLIVADQAGARTCWDISRRLLLGELPQEFKLGVQAFAFSPDGRIFAHEMTDKTIGLWDLAHRKYLGSPLQGHTQEIHNLAFSPDAKTLVSVSSWEMMYFWDVGRQEPLGSPISLRGYHSWMINQLAFSPDGKILATGSADRIVFWDPRQRRLIGPLVNMPSFGLRDIVFSPDGSLLAANDDQGSILLWDVAQRHPLPVTIKGQAKTLAFSSDGNTLISIGSYGAIEYYDLRLPIWQALACQRANRNLTKAEWQQYLPDEPYRRTCPNLPAPED